MDDTERARALGALFGSQAVAADDEVKEAKYRNRKVEYDEITFDSQAEFEYYLILKAREAAGQISKLEVHSKFMLQEGFKDRDGKRVPPIHYKADFTYVDDNGDSVVVDVKGFETPVWKIKRKLFLFRYPELRLDVIAVNSKRRR